MKPIDYSFGFLKEKDIWYPIYAIVNGDDSLNHLRRKMSLEDMKTRNNDGYARKKAGWTRKSQLRYRFNQTVSNRVAMFQKYISKSSNNPTAAEKEFLEEFEVHMEFVYRHMYTEPDEEDNARIIKHLTASIHCATCGLAPPQWEDAYMDKYALTKSLTGPEMLVLNLAAKLIVHSERIEAQGKEKKDIEKEKEATRQRCRKTHLLVDPDGDIRSKLVIMVTTELCEKLVHLSPMLRVDAGVTKEIGMSIGEEYNQLLSALIALRH